MNTLLHRSLIALCCSAKPKPGEKLVACSPISAVMAADANSDAPLPKELVWMPRGDHEISAGTMHGSTWTGMVRCDELGASIVIASFERVRARNLRVWLDCNHDDGAATAWVTGFRWDAGLGIVASVDWTPLGEQCLREKRFYSFSPTFWVDWESGRVSGLVEGHAAGGLVNAPAFGAAMPALIAARLAGAEINANSAPGGSPGNHKSDTTMNREKMLKVLAALAVTVPADASDAQVAALYAQHVPVAAGATNPDAVREIATLREQLTALQSAAAKPEDHAAIKAMKAQLDALVAADKAAKKQRAEEAVQAAVERGAIDENDTAVRAHWVGLIESDEKNLAVLKAMKGKPTAQSVVIASDVTQRVNSATAHVVTASLVEGLKAYAQEKDQVKRMVIFSSSIAPALRDPNFRMGPILAANNLGSLAGNLIVQKSLTLLKIDFPALTAFSTDFKAEGVKKGQQVVARVRSIPTSSAFVPGVGYVRKDMVTTDVPVTIDQHNGIEIGANANELASTERDVFGEQVEGCHQRIGLDITASLYALLTAANFANVKVQALGGFGRPTMSAIAAEMGDRGVAKQGRVALLNSQYFDKLGQDGSIVSYAAFQRPELITEYMLPRVAGFQPYEANGLPGNAENLVGFCGTPDALVISTRVPNDYTLALPGASNGNVSIVTNPDTGISVMLVQYVDHAKAEAVWRVAYMWGVAKGQVNSGQRIASA